MQKYRPSIAVFLDETDLLKSASHLVSRLKKGSCSMLLDQMESGESFSTLLTLKKELSAGYNQKE